MERIGIARSMDKMGRVVIPKHLREILDLGPGTEVEWFVEDKSIILRRRDYSCIFCSETTAQKYRHQPVCKECQEEIAELEDKEEGRKSE